MKIGGLQMLISAWAKESGEEKVGVNMMALLRCLHIWPISVVASYSCRVYGIVLSPF